MYKLNILAPISLQKKNDIKFWSQIKNENNLKNILMLGAFIYIYLDPTTTEAVAIYMLSGYKLKAIIEMDK
uniref:Uncharacterized protein n=1 Tax=Solanum lycopersicum TaxID=4081 RepID=A0A3Q7H0X4_SOLLC